MVVEPEPDAGCVATLAGNTSGGIGCIGLGARPCGSFSFQVPGSWPRVQGFGFRGLSFGGGTDRVVVEPEPDAGLEEGAVDCPVC